MAPADSRPPGCTRRNWPGQARLSSGGASVHRTDIKRPGGQGFLKIGGAALLFPITKTGRLRAFGATNFLGLGRWGLGRRLRLFLVFFDLGFILHSH